MPDDTDLASRADHLLANMGRVRPVLDKIADKWTIMILTVICPRPSRFNEIKRRLDGITHKSLADALKRLERHALVTRTVLPTPLGHSLRPAFESICEWALAHGEELEGAQPVQHRAEQAHGRQEAGGRHRTGGSGFVSAI